MYGRIAATAGAISLVPLAYAAHLSKKSDAAVAAATRVVLSEQANNSELRRQLNWQTQELLLARDRLEAAQKELEDDRSGVAAAVVVAAVGVVGIGALAFAR